MTDKTGGSAFPRDAGSVSYYIDGGNTRAEIKPDNGMTLRDYFAAKAMQSLVSARCFPFDDNIPAIAYHIADVMIAERSKGE